MKALTTDHYEQLATRERMRPRSGSKQASRTEASHWEPKRKKKGVDRCQKISYYLDTDH